MSEPSPAAATRPTARPPVPGADVPPLLEARALRVVRPGDDGPVAVLDGVDLTLTAGTLAEIAGPSGAGKTTLLLALARLLPGVTGELALNGAPASGIDPEQWRTLVALLPQRPVLVPGSVADNLRLPWTLKVRHGEQMPSDGALVGALASVGLQGIAPDRDVSRLSVGQVARIALLRLMLARPHVLLLDEPDASLDDVSAAEVARLTAAFVAEGGSVVRVSHVRADAAASVRYHLAGGRLAASAPAAVPHADVEASHA